MPAPAPAPFPDVLTWDLAFYEDAGGAPGAPLLLQSFAAVAVTSTHVGNGVFSAGSSYNVSFYDYSVELPIPFAAAAGIQYWFSVLSRSEHYNPAFALRGASGGDESSYQQLLGPGLSVVGTNAVARDRAIVLEGTLRVPEPGTLYLSFAALVLLAGLRSPVRRPLPGWHASAIKSNG